MAEAKSAVTGRRATDGEFIRHRLAGSPAMEAAVNNALLDLAARSSNVPVYQYLGGPTRFKARLLAHLEGATEEALSESLSRAAKQGYKAFTFPIPARDSLWPMQAYVDVIRKRVERLKAVAGPDPYLVLDPQPSFTPV